MCDKTARILIKRVDGVPTIPVSTDHRNGDWISTDIYEAEQAMDINTGVVYTRSAAGIETVGGGVGVLKQWKAQIAQTGTNAPVLTILVNTLGVTVTSHYDGVGDYHLEGFDGNLTGLCEILMSRDRVINTGIMDIFNSSTSIIDINTYDGGYNPSNNIFDPAGVLIHTITVTKYD
jgi:hypothetical protein